MTKVEIFNKILDVCCEVCNVSTKDVLDGSKKEDVVTARSLTIFWAVAAGFSVESLLRCVDRNNANSINYIKSKQEEFWVEKFAYHMLCIESGKRLLEFAHSLGEDFDMLTPLKHMGKITGKYIIRDGFKVRTFND